jgi:hypothetical protein
MRIVNVSSQMLFVQHRAHPSVTDPGGTAAIPVGPGRIIDLRDRVNGLPLLVWLFGQPRDGGGNRTLFWKGAVPPGGVIDADPAAGAVTWNRQSFDEAHLARARAFVGDGSLDGVTLEALRDHAESREPYSPAPDAAVAAAAASAAGDVQFTDCQLKVAGVVLDAVLLLLGMGALIKEANAQVAKAVADTLGTTVLDALQVQADALAAASPTGLQTATKVFGIAETLGTALPAVGKAAISNLSLLDKALYAGLAAAQIAAIALSGGGWAIPFILMQLGVGGVILLKDSVSCYETCNAGQPLPVVAPVVPEGSYIFSQGVPLCPSSNDSPRVVLWPHITPSETDLWEIELYTVGANGVHVVKFRSLAYPDLYMTAPPAVGGNLTLEPLPADETTGRCFWMASWFPPSSNPQNSDLSGYTLQLVMDGNMAIHVGGDGYATLQPVPSGVPPTDPGFFFQDLKMGDYDLANEIRIGWRLELFANNHDWSFWNGTEGSHLPLPAQEGTLTRPDDATYWSVVAMACSSGSAQGIAQVRCWSDASGRYVQAGFNARDSWFNYGKADPTVSTASDESYGAVLSAWIIDVSGDDGAAGQS